jgi:hypothetical protein
MAEGLLTFNILHESLGEERKSIWLPAPENAGSQVHVDAAPLHWQKETSPSILDGQEIESQGLDGTTSKGVVDDAEAGANALRGSLL